MDSKWLAKNDKQLLVLSPAGKPIFSLNDDFGESGLAVCSLLYAIASKTQNQLSCIEGHEFRLQFLYKGDLILVASATRRCLETNQQILAQLELLYNHILFHVTLPALTEMFEKNPSYDLSILLGGTDFSARNLLHFASSHLAITLNAIPTIPLPNETRIQLASCLETARCESNSSFALLLQTFSSSSSSSPLRPQLICGLGPRQVGKSKFNPFTSVTDFALLGNFVTNCGSSTMETWTPLCLPSFDNSGHFHCYASYLGVYNLFLVLCTTDPGLESFHLAAQKKVAFLNAIQLELFALEPVFRTPAVLFGFSSVVHHVALVMHGQMVESNQSGTKCPLNETYVLNRYACLKENSSADLRLVWDGSLRDCACLLRSSDLEIYCLFPPLVSLAVASAELSKMESFARKSKLRLFSL